MTARKFIIPLACCLGSLASGAVLAEDDAINVDVYKTPGHNVFGPPKPVAPPMIMSYRPENQFEPAPFLRPKAADAVDLSMKPGHLMAGRMGNTTYGGAFWRQRMAKWYLVGGLHYAKAGDYSDGAGQKQGFGYARDGEGIVLGLVPVAPAEIKLALMRDAIKDDKQPQHLMDPVLTRRLVGKIDARLGKPDDGNTVHVAVTRVDLKRRADNFSLREKPEKMPKIRLRVERKKTDVDLNYRLALEKRHRMLVGLRYKTDDAMGRRFIVSPEMDVVNGLRFPDVRQSAWGIYGGYAFAFNERHKIEAGLSWDARTSKALDADRVDPVSPFTPNQLWTQYYGKSVTGPIKNSGASGRIRYTWSPMEHSSVGIEYADLLRFPDLSEQFSSLFGPHGKGNVNNPFLNPERHRRILIEADLKGAAYRDYQRTREDDNAASWRLNVSAFYDGISDFVLLDRARGQKGVLMKDGTVVSRNVDARLAGAEARYSHNLTPALSMTAGAGFLWGHDVTDDRPLYRVRPFHADLAVDRKGYFSKGVWSLGAVLRYEHSQNRRDDDPKTGLGVDLAEAAKSHMVLDLHGSVAFKNFLGLNFGIDNVLNKRYAPFVINYHVESLGPKLIYAPGRTFWVNAHVNF